MSKMSMSKSIALAMAEEMRRDSTVYLWGLDVGAYGGAFGASLGLYDEFGPERVMDMPISEAGYTGMGVGSAITGLRPIVELEFNDWITIASDQLVNQAANMRHQFGGKLSVPMVLRAPCGAYTCEAQHHSHMFESWFAFIPGLKVVLPSNPNAARGLLKSAIRDNNPVIFLEHKRLYAKKGEVVDDPDFTIPLGKAAVVKEGPDLTIVTYSYMVDFAQKAAVELAKKNINVEIIDLQTIKPLDIETILESVKKTGRLLVLQETWLSCSVASEVSAQVAEKGFEYLKCPIRRIGSKDSPIPFGIELSEFVLPKVTDIIEIAEEMTK